MSYQHLSHLYAVAGGTFATLEGLTSDPLVQKAYLHAYDLLVAAIRDAHCCLAAILAAGSSAAQILDASRGCFWLLGALAKPIVGYAHAAGQNTPGADRALRAAVAQLRHSVERSPRRFFPSSLSDLSQTQFRVLCARVGFPVPQDDVGTNDGTGERALLAALAAARQAAASVTA